MLSKCWEKIYFQSRISIHSSYWIKWQNIHIFRHVRFQKAYLACTVSGKGTRESALPKPESKSRKNTRDAGHRRPTAGRGDESSVEDGEGDLRVSACTPQAPVQMGAGDVGDSHRQDPWGRWTSFGISGWDFGIFGWACSNSYLCLPCFDQGHGGYCSPLQPCSLLRKCSTLTCPWEEIGVSSEAESTKRPTAPDSIPSSSPRSGWHCSPCFSEFCVSRTPSWPCPRVVPEKILGNSQRSGSLTKSRGSVASLLPESSSSMRLSFPFTVRTMHASQHYLQIYMYVVKLLTKAKGGFTWKSRDSFPGVEEATRKWIWQGF